MSNFFKNIKNKHLAIVAILGVGIGLGILFFSENFSFSNIVSHDNKNIVREVIKEDVIPVSNINKIDIDADNSDVNVVSEERKDIKVKFEKDKGTKTSNYDVKASVNNNSLDIKTSGHKKLLKLFSVGSPQKLMVTIYVPKNYNKNLNIDTSLGNISLKNIKLDNLICKSGLGNANFNNVEVKNFVCNNQDGDITANKLYTNTTKINNDLGNATLKTFTGDLKMEIGSGNSDVSYEKLSSNVDIKADLGNVDIQLPKNTEFYLDAQAELGNIKCDFPVTIEKNSKDEEKLQGVVKSNKYKVIIENSDGNINIKRK